ncbi:MAG TPA: 2OG-Fe(II) oxygenase [Cyclobacteriaceae bacterium]|jgi:SM-20-related protein|nr:2OG-Fe(II) oxygenase [Cyclobacteriaceae bacterium]
MNLSQTDFEPVADGLANHGYAVVDDFLNEKEVESILMLDTFRQGLSEFKKAGIGQSASKQINESIRGDFIQWIDTNTAQPALLPYLSKIDALILFLNQSLFLSLKDFEMHMTVYPPGSYYKKHLDQFKADDHRKLSVICYLNTNWKDEHGGQLRMHFQNEYKDILPLAGRLVCFRSDQVEHEVLPATRERLSLTGWMLDQKIDLKHL